MTTNFNKKQLEKLLTELTKGHIKLVKWLYDKHKSILEQYENECLNGMRIEFLGRSRKNEN